jgi:hypothetical protein
MNWRERTTKPAKSTNNSDHPGRSHHQEDRSFTGIKVGVSLQKRQEGQEFWTDKAVQHRK